MKNLTCGQLRAKDAGKKVALTGWINSIRDQKDFYFIDLRDWDGITQVIGKKESLPEEVIKKLEKLSLECVVTIHGTVNKRPSGKSNERLKTQDIELELEDVDILNLSETLPYLWKDQNNTEISHRLKYRYIDLRSPKLQFNIRTRAKIVSEIRKYLEDKNFVDIETPILTKSTPEGARDYLVPSRVHKGKFYALPQSPQLFKQMLMISGMERYYQIARCFRDEDLRPDRQPEFTQVDIEMSFITQDDIIGIIEGLLAQVWKEVKGIELELPFPRMSYEEAMSRYGVDKPDTRFGMELTEITDLIPEEVSFLKPIIDDKNGLITAINVKGYGTTSNKKMNKLRKFVQIFKAKDVGYVNVLKNGEIKSPLTRFTSEEKIGKIVERMEAEEGDLILFVGDDKEIAYRSMGELRIEMAKEMNLIPEDKFNFLWVIDFPLFEWSEEQQRWTAMHHPFTSCKPEYVDTFDKDPGSAFANAYDIVLNGYEIGGGSIRIHNTEVQSRMFKALGISDEMIEINFSFLTEALRYGAPPHGGIALGLDRIVMIMTGEPNIQDVIAFPKLRNARMPLGDAPSFVEDKQLDELGIDIKPEIRALIEKEKTETLDE